MADIRIEKKKPVWPWIVLLIVIAAIIYIFVIADDETTVNDQTNFEQIDETGMDRDSIN